MPEMGSGCTGKARFWWTPASVHQMRDVSGSAEAKGATSFSRRSAHELPSRFRLTVAIICRWPSSPVFQRPMWWLQATTPGRMPSVTQAFTTKWPMRVSTRTRSPVSTPSFAASLGCSHRGFVCAISSSHLAFALRVWIWTGRRNVGMSGISPGPRCDLWTWLLM